MPIFTIRQLQEVLLQLQMAELVSSWKNISDEFEPHSIIRSLQWELHGHG
jgi:hypothetical protein